MVVEFLLYLILVSLSVILGNSMGSGIWLIIDIPFYLYIIWCSYCALYNS